MPSPNIFSAKTGSGTLVISTTSPSNGEYTFKLVWVDIKESPLRIPLINLLNIIRFAL